MKLQRKGEFLSTRVQYIPLGRIRPNPQQPRQGFDEVGLAELAASIRSCGILQPLTVRRAGDGYELVAGERRLRAARIAGLREVPCLVAQVGEEDSALLALMENLQRRDLDCWEEAAAIARLISRYGLSQEEAARRLAQAEAHVEKLLQEDRTTPPRGRSTYIIKDVRLFLNSVDRGLHLMRQAGVDAGWDRRDTEQEILLTIRIPKRART